MQHVSKIQEAAIYSNSREEIVKDLLRILNQRKGTAGIRATEL